MLNNFFNSIERSGHINLVMGSIVIISFIIALTIIGIVIYKSDKKK
ncbi:hypothetical protein Clopa_0926 [Clostridium pasteurianum BC1]|uniref:Uncharacterized protein n=1 Tax=Clostridium pasteurianum BC1 TaxID=86416 RepID=R4K048_CLOPA|nr:hypothetical protein Clopa_0926 [Clostridium pasteurianum BC1]